MRGYDHAITLDDRGKHIYMRDGYDVWVPPNDNEEFPVGSVITIINSNYLNNNNDVNVKSTGMGVDVWGAGFNTTSSAWGIPANSIGTLVKVETNKWILSAAGLKNNQ